MTHYINELADMVPQCAALGRKPDKLTILRMAVSHMKSIRGTGNTAADGSYKPSFLTDQELKHLILEAANGFLFVVSCDTGKVLYAADSIAPVLNVSQTDFIDRCVFDMVHPDDVDKVREQLSPVDGSSLNRVLDLKTGTVKKESQQCRSSSCVTPSQQCACTCPAVAASSAACVSATSAPACSSVCATVAPSSTTPTDTSTSSCTAPGISRTARRRYDCYIHVSIGQGLEHMLDVNRVGGGSMLVNMDGLGHCLIAIGRLQIAAMPQSAPTPPNTVTFTTRHGADGQITFVDERVSQALVNVKAGDLVGKPWTAVANAADAMAVADAITTAMAHGDQSVNVQWRMSLLGGDSAPITSTAYKFTNPYSDEFEYIVATHTVACAAMSMADVAGDVDAMQGYANATSHLPTQTGGFDHQHQQHGNALYSYGADSHFGSNEERWTSATAAAASAHSGAYAHIQ